MGVRSSDIRAGRAFVEIGTNNTELERGLRLAQQKLRAFGASVRQLGASLVRIGSIAGLGFGIATRVFAGFDDRMRAVKAVTGATAEEFRLLQDEAKRLGRTTSFTAGQVAEAMTELGRAGFSPNEILQATESVLALARATSTELPRATEIAGAALRGFSLETSQIGRVTDVLTATANKSAQTLEDLFEALKPVAPIAVEAGESIEDTAAALGVLANNGIKGSLAGNALARAYKNLSDESKRAKLAEIGVQAVDAAGNLRPLADILNDLARATKGMGSADRLAIFETLFGRGQAAALKLASGAEAFDTLNTEIKSAAGIAVKTAQEMDAGIGGAFRMLLSAVEGIAIAVGEAIELPVRRAARALTQISAWITKVVEGNRELVALIATVTAGVLALGVGLMIAGTFVITFSAVLGAAAKVIALTRVALSTLTLGFKVLPSLLITLMSPMGLVIVGLGALAAVFLYVSGIGGKALDWLRAKFGTLRDLAVTAIGGIGDALAAGDVGLAARIMWTSLKVAWTKGTKPLADIWQNSMHTLQTAATNAFFSIREAWALTANWFWTNFPAFTAGLATSWADMWSDFKTIAARAKGWLADVFVDVMALGDPEIDVAGTKRLNREDLNRDLAEIERKREEAYAEAQRKMQQTDAEREQELRQRLTDLENEREKALEDIESRHQDKLKKAEQELNEARAEWLKAVEDAGRKRSAQENAGAGSDESGPATVDPDRIKRMLAEVGEDLADRIVTGIGVRGVFNVAAIQSLASGSDSLDERKLRELESINRLTKKLVDEHRRGAMYTFR